MADENNTTDLDISDDEAAKLLSDEPDNTAEAPDRDTTDWKAEAQKWKSLSRKNETTAKQTAERLQKHEDAKKTESERLQEALTTHQTRADKAEAALKRREIAENRAPDHATAAQIRTVAKRLAGDSDDDLEADADELFALLAPVPAEVKAAKTPSRPKERLRGGDTPDEEPDETDPRKLAALIPRRR